MNQLKAFLAVACLAAVLLLCRSGQTANVEFHWIAPGDDGDTGTATAYEMYLHTDSLSAANNPAGGILVSNMPVPSPAGICQQVVISGLEPDTWYWAVMRTRDEVYNWSPWSNIKAKTPDATPPALTVIMAGPCP